MKRKMIPVVILVLQYGYAGNRFHNVFGLNGKKVNRLYLERRLYMRNNIKKWMSVILTLALVVAVLPIENVHAEEIMTDPATGLRYKEIVSGYEADPHFEWEKEILVYIDSEEDLFKLEHNPDYRYIYQWETPSLTRAVCYECGKSTMSTVREFAQWGCDYKNCPLSFGTGLVNDYYNTWTYMLYERCTSCGERGDWREENSANRTYTSFCSNKDNPGDGSEWKVLEASQFNIAIHNVHQYKPWWTSKQLPY